MRAFQHRLYYINGLMKRVKPQIKKSKYIEYRHYLLLFVLQRHTFLLDVMTALCFLMDILFFFNGDPHFNAFVLFEILGMSLTI